MVLFTGLVGLLKRLERDSPHPEMVFFMGLKEDVNTSTSLLAFSTASTSVMPTVARGGWLQRGTGTRQMHAGGKGVFSRASEMAGLKAH